MDYIKVAKVQGVSWQACAYPTPVHLSPPQPVAATLHLTPHHLIVQHNGTETWLPFPLIHACTIYPINALALSPLVIRTRDFKAYTLFFRDYTAATLVWESCKAVIANATIESMYALCQPSTSKQPTPGFDGWRVYDPVKEFDRMGAIPRDPAQPARSNAWRWSTVNANYDFCSTYPAQLAVPVKISDVTLKYGKPYRSKHRIPALVYLHWANLGSITRSSQPMAGLLNNARSIQDEKLIEAIFHSHNSHTTSKHASFQGTPLVYGARAANLIIDARPTTNARANAVKGAGSENMDYYKDCKKEYLGIDNIHVMRDSLRSLNEALIASEATGSIDKHALRKSGWLRHLSLILDGALIIVKNVHVYNSHVLIHCSDGWDRTAQLSALSQICLDPYYRTIEGLAVLIEKDFASFGHKFNQRTGHTVPDRTAFVSAPGSDVSPQAAFLANVQKGLVFSSAHFKETSPVFHQFLDCVYQLCRQFPSRFEFDQRLLASLLYHLHSCQFGNFLFDCEQDRVRGRRNAPSVWELYLKDQETRASWRNPSYDPSLDDPHDRKSDQGVLIFDPKDVKYWYELFGRSDDEMNNEENDLSSAIVDLDVADEARAKLEEEGRNEYPGNIKRTSLVAETATLPHTPSSFVPTSPSKLTTPFIDPAAQATLQSAAQSVWKFGNSSWRAVKSGVSQAAQRVQANDISSSGAAAPDNVYAGSPAPIRTNYASQPPRELEANPWSSDSASPLPAPSVSSSAPPAVVAGSPELTADFSPVLPQLKQRIESATSAPIIQEPSLAPAEPSPTIQTTQNWGNDPLGVS